eukprot:sb/3479065/
MTLFLGRSNIHNLLPTDLLILPADKITLVALVPLQFTHLLRHLSLHLSQSAQIIFSPGQLPSEYLLLFAEGSVFPLHNITSLGEGGIRILPVIGNS